MDATGTRDVRGDAGAVLRVLVVPGATPGRWLHRWAERRPTPATLVHAAAHDALDRLRAGEADVGLVRLDTRPDDVAGFRLYDEATVVVVPRDHVVAAADDVTLADLADLADESPVLVPADDVLGLARVPGVVAPGTTAEAVELVAAGVGVLVVPQSLARLHDHRDLTYRPVTDAPTSAVWLAWPADRTTDDVEHFVGIVRGRTANSSRGPSPARGADDGATAARPARPARTGRRTSGSPPDVLPRPGRPRRGGTSGRRRRRA